MDQNSGEHLEQAFEDTSSSIRGSWRAKLFIVFLCLVFVMTIVCLLQEQKLLAILVALIAGAALWMLEVQERKLRFGFKPVLRKGFESLTAVAIISAVAFIACFPTLHIYFLTDEFALIHAFHNLSAEQFLQLLHMGTRQFVSGDLRQEFRPLYSLYYLAAYHLWGLRLLGYHLCEILFHTLVSVLVFLIAKALAPENIRAAGVAGVLFAVQPPHAQAMSLIVGLVAESLPAVFYLTAFLFFIHFRACGRRRHLVISIGAFTACLLTKESAVTLPVVLFSFDLFRIGCEEGFDLFSDWKGKFRRWKNLVLPYVPYAVLLFVYMSWRRRVLSSFLREDNWGSHATEIVASPQGFFYHLFHFASHAWQLQAFNFQTLFPYSTVVLGLVLALFLFWAFSLLRVPSENRRSVALILYFGLVWYVMTNLPYLIEEHVPYHLYLPTTGLCIGFAFLAFPENCIQKSGYSRILGMIFFVVASTGRMWSGEAQYVHLGELSASMTRQLAVSLRSIPGGRLVILSPGDSSLVAEGWGEGIVPFSVQSPFTTSDLTENVHIVEDVDMSCCGPGEWWLKHQPMLVDEEKMPPSDEVTVYSFAWDENAAVFQLSSRTMQGKLLADCINKTLGGPPGSIDAIEDTEAIQLVKSLKRLVEEPDGTLKQR